MIVAVFNDVGSSLLEKDKLTILHKTGRILSRDTFNNEVGIGSNEHDFEFKDEISFLKSVSLTGRSSVSWGTARGTPISEKDVISVELTLLRSCLILAIF